MHQMPDCGDPSQAPYPSSGAASQAQLKCRTARPTRGGGDARPELGASVRKPHADGFQVDDIATEVAELLSRGVVFETYDMPGFDAKTMIATFEANRSAWFKDTEGNLIGIVELLA